MRLVIKRLKFQLLGFICLTIANNHALAINSVKINPNDIVSTHDTYREIRNESICADNKFGTFSPLQVKILKHSKLWGSPINWLGSTYYCGAVNHQYFKDGFIHEYNDANSPMYVYILIDRNTKKYLIAKVERSDWLQLISDGKITYIGSLLDMAQAKSILAKYISNQKHS